MLRLVRDPSPSNEHEDLFLSHYDQVAAWALQLTNQDQHEAEDLAQDAFIDFVRSHPDLIAIRNLDAYLYTFLRNLHRSRLHRHLRRRDLLLSVIDYDSAETGLYSSDPGHLFQVSEDLYRVCDFACERKETSKAGSILILRFFHGFSLNEVAAILRADRSTVDSRLNLARKEARLHLEDPDKLKRLGSAGTKVSRRPSTAANSEELICELRKRIFEAQSGSCLSIARLKELYRPDSLQTPDHAVLAHIVSCRKCLDAVNRFLGLPPLSERSMDGSDSDADPPRPRMLPGSRKGKTKKDRVARWRRLADGINDHYPRELMVAVNGVPVLWQEVLRDRNEFSLRLQQTDRVEFIEVLSEQGVRLLSLLVMEPPPEGPWKSGNDVMLSGGRHLSIALRFETLWPVVHISYSNSVVASERETTVTAPCANAIRSAPVESQFGIGAALAWLFRTRALTTALALILIVALLFYQSRDTTLSAAALLAHADVWEHASLSSGRVTHRVFDLDERGPGGAQLLSRKRVEIWQEGSRGKKLRRLFNPNGALVASSTENLSAAPPMAGEVWKYEPSADNFRLLSPEISLARVLSSLSNLEVASRTVVLILDRATYQPIAETVFVQQREYRFTEDSFETIPLQQSPFGNPDEVGPAHSRAARGSQRTSFGPTEAQLEGVEMAVRVALHNLRLDLSRSIDIRREHERISISGVVDSRLQREQLASALGHVPYVALAVLTPEEASPNATAQALSQYPSFSTVAPALLHDWLERQYPSLAERQEYTERIVVLSHEVLRRAYAIADLEKRYPKIEPPEIRAIAEDHQKVLRQNWSELRGLTGEVLGIGEPAVTGASQTLPSKAEAFAVAVKDFDRHLLTLFTDDASPLSASASTTAESELNACRGAARIIVTMLAEP
jgi:RNA polymerase sigma factor (sigma-70 family)